MAKLLLSFPFKWREREKYFYYHSVLYGQAHASPEPVRTCIGIRYDVIIHLIPIHLGGRLDNDGPRLSASFIYIAHTVQCTMSVPLRRTP